MTKLEKYFYYFLLTLFIYITIGFKLIPYIAENQLVKNLDERLITNTSLKKIEFNPFIFQLKVHNLYLKQNDKTVVGFDKLIFDFNLIETVLDSHINIKEIIIEKIITNIEENNGSLNLANLVKKQENKKTEENETQSSNDITFLIKKILIKNSTVNYIKRENKNSFSINIHDINYSIYNLGTFKNPLASLNLNFKINENTSFEKKGALKLSPYISSYGNMKLNDLRLNELINYKKDLLNFKFAQNSNFEFDLDYNTNIKNKLDLNIKSNKLNINNLDILQSNNSLIKFDKFSINKLNFDLLKEQIAISEILLINFTTKVTKDDEKINLLKLINTNEAKNEEINTNKQQQIKEKNNWKIGINAINLNNINLGFEDIKEKIVFDAENININVEKIDIENEKISINQSSLYDANFDVKLLENLNKKIPKNDIVKKEDKSEKSTYLDIGPVKLKNLNFNFQDNNLPLVFESSITRLNGEISQFKTDINSRSILKVNGEVNKYGIAKINGLINPYDIKFLTDVKIILQNIAVDDFSAYSGKFVGKKLKSGKLDIDLKYNIVKSNLDAKNSIIITKLEFGDDVKSKEALSLPLGLAIALLEDSNGVIDLNIPIKGSLENPEFEIAPIIWKTLVNLITKAVTAPFSFIGSLFGFDEKEIKYVKFEFAKSNIGPIQKESLDKIAEILPKKPKIVLLLKPTYNQLKDKKELIEIRFNSLISKQIENKQIIDYENKYIKVLETQYLKTNKELKTIKDNSMIDNKFYTKKYISNLEESVKNQIIITNKDLEKLASKRVENIRNYLINEKSINKNQLKIVEDYTILEDEEDILKIELSLENIN